jgi:hypothetical protein
MYYLERLIRRALAVPRNMPGRMFDPFEQIAPWLIEPAVALNPATREQADNPVEAGMPPLPHVAPSVSPQPAAPGALSEAVAAVQPPPPASAVIQTVDRFLELPRRDAEVAPSGIRPEAPLAKADAFMRALNVTGVTPETAKSVEPGQPRERMVSVEATPRARQEAPSAPPTPKVQLVRPIPPRRTPPEHPPPPRPTLPTSASPAREERAPHRTTTVAAAQPAALRTIVVAPAARQQFDDLAHSSGISYFGIGQG